MKHFDKPLSRVLTYLPGGGGGGVGGGGGGWGGEEDSDIFTHGRLRPFLGVQNLLISIFFWDSHVYIYK